MTSTTLLRIGIASLSIPGYFIGTSTLATAEEDLPLKQALYEAIENNLTLQINAYQPYLKEQDIAIANASFDSSLFGSVSMDKQEQDWTQSESESSTATVGVTKTFTTGTSVTLRSNYIKNDGSRFDSSLNQEIGGNLSHNSGITLSIRQPLLQNFGKTVNTAYIKKAEAALAIAQLEYKNQVLDVISQTENAYWRLVYQHAYLELSRSSVELAENLLSETMERAEVGLATQLDVLQAQANLATQNENLFDAKSDLADSQDQLLVYMGRLQPGFQEQDIVVGELPDVSDTDITLNDAWSGAVTNDLDLVVQEATIESLGLDRILAKDKTKSDLDLVLSGSTSGFSDESGTDSFSGAFEPDGHDWGIGFELSVPIGKRSSKATLNKYDAMIKREAVRMDQIEQNLFMSVRQAWRALNASLEKLDATRVTMDLQQKAFEQEQAKYNEGLAVFRDVQEAQEAVDRARISEINAWYTSLKALVDLSRLDGSILDRHAINVNFDS